MSDAPDEKSGSARPINSPKPPTSESKPTPPPPAREAADLIKQLTRERDEARAENERHREMWFYLTAHPEDAIKAADEALGLAEYGRDSAGHMTTPLEAKSEQPRGAIAAAVWELIRDHRPNDNMPGCVVCYPQEGTWPCLVRLVADDLRATLGVVE